MTNKILISSLIVFLVGCTSQTAVPIATDTPILTIAPNKLSLTPPSIRISILTITETPSPTAKVLDLILNSPNREFIAEFDNAYGHPYTETQVIEILDKNGSLLWKIPFQYPIADCDPHPRLTIYGWSKDSAYLYFYYDFSPDGGDFAFWWDGFDLQRINVQNGDIERVMPVERDAFVAFAFSSDETQVAYTYELDSPSIIHIRNLSTGAEKTSDVIFPSKSYLRVGDIHWSPSGKEIAFQTEDGDYMAQTIYLDLSTMKQKVIKEYRVGSSYFQGWSNDGNLEFTDLENGVHIVHVNPRSDETIVIRTPTTRP